MDLIYLPFFIGLLGFAVFIHQEVEKIRELLEKKLSEDKED